MYRIRHSIEYLFIVGCVLGLLFTGYIVASSQASVPTTEMPQCSLWAYPGYPGQSLVPGYPGYPGQDLCTFLPRVERISVVSGEPTATPTQTPTATPSPTPTATPTVTPNPYP